MLAIDASPETSPLAEFSREPLRLHVLGGDLYWVQGIDADVDEIRQVGVDRTARVVENPGSWGRPAHLDETFVRRTDQAAVDRQRTAPAVLQTNVIAETDQVDELACLPQGQIGRASCR